MFIYRQKLWKNVIIFGADISSSVHIANENKDILILGEEPTERLDDTALTLLRMEKVPSPTTFSPATSRNVGISPENLLTFSFNPFDRLV